jgi:drug/metabolite transporter (DMT)-like permease
MNAAPGIIAAFLTLGCWTIGTLSFTKASKLSSPLSVNRVRLLYACIILTAVILVTGGLSFAELFSLPSAAQWIWLGISGIIGLSIGDFFAFTAFRMMGSSRTSLFHTFGPCAALIFGFLFLNETINPAGIIGMLISIAGLLWFIRTNPRDAHEPGVGKKEILMGALFAALAAITQGIGLVFSKKGLLPQAGVTLSAIHATWIRMVIGTAVIYAAGLFRVNLWKELRELSSSPALLRPMLTGTVFGPVMGVSFSLFAASRIEVSVAQTIFSLLPVSVISVAMLSGRERPGASSLIAAAVGVGGVFVLVWRNEIGAIWF